MQHVTSVGFNAHYLDIPFPSTSPSQEPVPQLAMWTDRLHFSSADHQPGPGRQWCAPEPPYCKVDSFVRFKLRVMFVRCRGESKGKLLRGRTTVVFPVGAAAGELRVHRSYAL